MLVNRRKILSLGSLAFSELKLNHSNQLQIILLYLVYDRQYESVFCFQLILYLLVLLKVFYNPRIEPVFLSFHSI